MKLTSPGFKHNGQIPGEFAFCVIDSKTHVTLPKNRNPVKAADVIAAIRGHVLAQALITGVYSLNPQVKV